MKVSSIKEILPETFVLGLHSFKDDRGEFVKTFHEDVFAEHNLNLDMKEEFYSLSKKDVIRGMHFQLPPHEHAKYVYCVYGAVTDVLLDLRKEKPTYGNHVSLTLDCQSPKILIIPKGIAHGFVSLSGESIMVYKTSSIHNPSADAGIRWDSFGYDWGVKNPIISERDKEFPSFSEFKTPF